MSQRGSVAKTTRYAVAVDTLQEAFAFVMSKLDEVGERPSITITPVACLHFEDLTADDDDEEQPEPDRFFEVTVSSMAEEPATDEAAS